MSNILDIASSALMAYRAGLASTGENIANVDTEGYRRRDLTTSTMGGAQMTPISLPTGAQGVQVDEVRRAFDSFLAQKVSTTTSDLNSAETFAQAVGRMEDLFVPESGGLSANMDDFFASAGRLATNPTDIALRRVVMESGKALASGVSDLALSLESLGDDLKSQATTAARQVTGWLGDLAELNERIIDTPDVLGTQNALFDERDRLINKIGEMIAIRVNYDDRNTARVTLGDLEGGPLLVERGEFAQIEVNTDGAMQLLLNRDGTVTRSTQITGGVMEGLARAIDAVRDTGAQFDALARRLVNDMNFVHAQGLDLNGQAGEEMFSLDGWRAVPIMTNRGSSQVFIETLDPEQAAALGDITLVRDEVRGVWQATDANGALLAEAADVLQFGGVRMTLSGTARDGDRFVVRHTDTEARNMRWALDAPEQIAAAAASLVTASATNTGSGAARMTALPYDPPALTAIGDFTGFGEGAADAVDLLKSGVVGYLPAGTTEARFAAVGEQATLSFAQADPSAGARATDLTFQIGTETHQFVLSASGAATLTELADALNAGNLLSTEGDSLAALGVTAVADGNGLVLSLGQGIFATNGSFAGTNFNVSGVQTAPVPADGSIQIFTREGVQISGPMMDAAAAAALLTEANGFWPGATYDPSQLSISGTDGYRGLNISRAISEGPDVIRFGAVDPVVWTGTAPAPAAGAYSVVVSDAFGVATNVTVPEGGSARQAAALLSDALDGTDVTARTDVMLSNVTDGAISFRLVGQNTEPVLFNAQVVRGRLDAIAQAVNAKSAATGVTAGLSGDGTRLMLTHATGETIELRDMMHGAGGSIDAQAVDRNGAAIGVSNTLSTGESLRVAGQVQLASETSLGVIADGVSYVSAKDPELGGLMTRTASAAGSVQTVRFALDAALDGADVSTSGLEGAGPGATVSIDFEGQTFSAPMADTSAMGAALTAAGALREGLVQPAMSGAAVATLPADGVSTSVMLGEEVYVLTMANGAVQVSGPEEGRLSASFDANNQLQVTVNGGGTGDGAVLRSPLGTPGRDLFGLGSGAETTLTGQPYDPANLPASFNVTVNGTDYDVTLSGAGVTTGAGFPGAATVNGGRLELSFASDVGAVGIAAQAGADAAGMTTRDATISAAAGALTVRATDGRRLDMTVNVAAHAADRVTLSNLPNEDLIVVMQGQGALRLTGTMLDGPRNSAVPAVEARVENAETGEVGLYDSATGDRIGSSILDSQGKATIGGVEFSISGQFASGDVFRLSPNTAGRGDSRNLDALTALRTANTATGKGGFADILSALQSEKGAQVAAANSRVDVAGAAQEAAMRVWSEQGEVDLDREAARLLEQQQAYQANAQVLSAASRLFDTLLNAM